MRRRFVTPRVALAAAALAAPMPAAATHDLAPGMTQHTAQNDLGTMSYHVYAPAQLTGRVPLFVHLHGANNKTVDAAHRSRLNELASERGFVVAYPQEDPNAGNNGIWDWTGAAEAGREGRATSLVAQIAREAMAAHPVDPRRVYVGGVSAGAGMALVVAVQYSDVFTALQLEVGETYGEAEAEAAGRRVYEVMGARARRIPLMMSWGSADPIAAATDQESTLRSWLIAHDWIDDGADNGSVPLSPVATRTGTDGKNYSVRTFADAAGCVLAEAWIIEGMSHAYAGGDQVATYGPADVVSDPNAPNMRAMAYDFFLDQLDAEGPPCSAARPAVGSEHAGGLGVATLGVLAALARRRRQDISAFKRSAS